MTLKIDLRTAGLLFAAGLAWTATADGANGANGATGVTVTRIQEIAIRTGMSADEVREILGRPANIFLYRSATGPTWVYHVVGALGTRDFDVEFGPDGRVASARERSFPSGG